MFNSPTPKKSTDKKLLPKVGDRVGVRVGEKLEIRNNHTGLDLAILGDGGFKVLRREEKRQFKIEK